MRITRLVGIVAVAGAVILTAAGCTSGADANAAGCAAWAKISNAWATAEHSSSTSSADLASLRSDLRPRLDAASRGTTGDVQKAMSGAVAALPANALHIVEPGAQYRSAFDESTKAVAAACDAVGHAVRISPAPTLP